MRSLNIIRRASRSRGALRAGAALAVAAATLGFSRNLSAQQREREVLLGGLFPLTGSWSSQGQAARAAMEIAVADVNRYLEGNAARIRFVTAIEDTRLDPGIALEKAQMLKRRGVQLLIGPNSSAEVARLKPFVDANGVLLVSPASTAGTLAIVGDNVFRFTPSDSLESVAVSSLMWEDGVRVVVPVWRDDAGNAGLERATRARVTSLGGAVLDGVPYGVTTRDFGTTVAELGAQVRRAVAQHGADKVAVYLAAFDEAALLFASASADSALSSVRWYGSDGVAHSDSLVTNRQAAAFAIRTGFPNPVFGFDEGARDIWEPLAARIRARSNVEPDAFALTIYDAVWVVARGYIASGATLDIDQLKHAFTTAASTQFGATGWTVLNAAGDRKYGDFDFWAVREVAGAPAWIRVAQYETRTKRVVRLPAETLLGTTRTAATLSLADVAGRWNVRAVPETGQAVATWFVLNASADTTGWTVRYAPNREPIPVRVIAVAGDSLVLESAPYLSARRPGLKAVSRDVYRLVGSRLVGYSVGRYLTSPEVVLRLRLEGTPAPGDEASAP
ncbi:MAG TPA: ABC transporter substrate-binding protein [Gemmatimonadales bacterium]|nr:ABC transporter substrate-binding protein [Gemmatimonadales bacterium]